MSQHLLQTIADLETEIANREKQTAELKRSANVLCGMAGIPAKYDSIDAPAGTVTTKVGMAIREDEWVNTALNTAVKEYLTKRKASGLEGPASAEEIQSALEQGGYDFETKDKAAAVSGLKISLGKSSHTFKKLNSGKYGLNEWYNINPRRNTGKKADSAEVVEGADAAIAAPASPEVVVTEAGKEVTT